MPDRIETRLAVMTLTEGGRLIEVHYREGADLDSDGLMEVLQRRTELTTERCAMVAFFQAGTLGDMSTMSMDHFAVSKANEQLVALAIVTEDNLGEAMSGIYYSYHPQPFPTRVFRARDEAMAWLKGVLKSAFPND